MIEREKRWKLKNDPPKDKIKDKFLIEQTYAHFSPDVRVRKITKGDEKTFYHTVKYNLENNEREEIEQRLSEERYNKIFNSIDKKPITKERTVVDLGSNLVGEIDYFLDTGDKIVEVEFPKVEDMNNFIIPEWFGKELKENKSFSVEVFEKINKSNDSIWNKIGK